MRKLSRASGAQVLSMLAAWVVVSGILLLSSCGGGTSGTGGDGTTRVLGRVVDQDQQAVAAGSVSIAETGDSGVTDAEGNFALDTHIAGDELTFLVEKNTNQASATLSDLPEQPTSIEVLLKLDQPKNSLVIDASTVRPRPTPPQSSSGAGGASATPTPRPIEFTRTRLQVAVIASTGALEGARVSIAGANITTKGLYVYPYTDGLSSYTINLPLLKGRVTQVVIRTARGRTFRIDVGVVDPQVEYVVVYVRLLPHISADQPLPPEAGMSLDFLHVAPDRFDQPGVSISPAPGGAFGPTPTPTPIAIEHSETQYFFAFRYPGDALLGARLVSTDPAVAPITLQQLEGNSQTFVANVRAPSSLSSLQFTLETASRNYSIGITGIEPTLYSASFNLYLVPRDPAADYTQNPPHWIEISQFSTYPERGRMRVHLSPTPPARR